MPGLNAALGCAQLHQLTGFVDAKRALAEKYSNWFTEIEGVKFFLEPRGTRSNYWLNAILLRNRDERDWLLEHTNSAGVMTRPMWTPMHTLPMYENSIRGDLSVAEDIEGRLVNIPSSVV